MIYGYIYKIENQINGKIYIGQSINPDRRKYEHFNDLNNNKHYNSHLQNSFNKYGESNFKHTILNWSTNKKYLDKLEIYFIKKYNTTHRDKGYNLLSGGSKGKHSLETRKKISESIKGEKHHRYGKHLSKDHKNKLSAARRNYYKKHPEFQKGKNHSMYGKSYSWHGFKGVTYAKKDRNPWTKVWQCSIRYKGKNNSLGFFNEPLSGEIVYNLVKEELYL